MTVDVIPKQIKLLKLVAPALSRAAVLAERANDADYSRRRLSIYFPADSLESSGFAVRISDHAR